jgi:hypothetical protein
MATIKSAPASASPASDQVERAARPALGTIANFKVAEGVQLINSETGTYFAPGVATPQTVTVTTLRRLDDLDLQLA